MKAVHVLHLFSRLFAIPDHYNLLLLTSIFVEAECPNGSVPITCFFLLGIIFLSPAKDKTKRLSISLKTGGNFSGLVFLVVSQTYFQL